MSKLTVAIKLQYVRRCEECVAYARQTVSAALYDGQVTSISLQAVDRCEHETAKDLTARLRTPSPATPPPLAPRSPEATPLDVTDLIPDLQAEGVTPNGFDQGIS